MSTPLSDLSDTARALIVDAILKIDAGTFSDSVKDEIILWARLVSGECCSNTDCINAGTQWHVCPYKHAMFDDSETLCNCCDDCRWQCLQDI